VSLALHTILLSLPIAAPLPPSTAMPSKASRVQVRLEQVRDARHDMHAAAPPAAPAHTPAEPAGKAPASEAPAQGGVGLPAHYFKSSEVDQRAEPVKLGILLYPDSAYLRRIPGVVALRVFLNETGGIDAIDVIESHPPGIFEQAAIDAVLNTRFAPARLLGHAVRNVKTVEIRFDPYQDRPLHGTQPAAPDYGSSPLGKAKVTPSE
jgi:TonB family protein